MNTFIDLYNHIISLEDKSIYNFLKDDNFTNFEKQESLLRLFSYLKLIPDFNDYIINDGDFNNGIINLNNDIRLLLNKKLKDKGNKSDLTLIKDNIIYLQHLKIIISI